jgi:lysozyme-like protein
MPNLTSDEIRAYATGAGFRGDDLNIAVAVALAESSGDPGAVGDEALTIGGSIGLWQINLRWHPEYAAASLVDPQTNANAAFAIYVEAGHSFIPWSTYKSGAYLEHLDTQPS